jgi:2-polyprenyl-6-methoxyphenol hydroxylase-like FAD-dependent oxidoreductase
MSEGEVNRGVGLDLKGADSGSQVLVVGAGPVGLVLACELARRGVTVRLVDAADVPADLQLSGLDRDFWHWWPSPDGQLLALCPLATTDAFQIQAGVSADTSGELSLEEIQALIDVRSGRTDIRVHRVTWQSIWRSNVRMVDCHRAGRVFLAGTPPTSTRPRAAWE